MWLENSDSHHMTVSYLMTALSECGVNLKDKGLNEVLETLILRSVYGSRCTVKIQRVTKFIAPFSFLFRCCISRFFSNKLWSGLWFNLYEMIFIKCRNEISFFWYFEICFFFQPSTLGLLHFITAQRIHSVSKPYVFTLEFNITVFHNLNFIMVHPYMISNKSLFEMKYMLKSNVTILWSLTVQVGGIL